MEPYLVASHNGVFTVFNYDSIYFLEPRYVIHQHEPTSGIDLTSWLITLEKGVAVKQGTALPAVDLTLTPVSAIVPWLLAGLREAILTDHVHDLLKIIHTVKEAGFKSDELDVIERSLLVNALNLSLNTLNQIVGCRL